MGDFIFHFISFVFNFISENLFSKFVFKEFLETLFFNYPFDIPESEALNDLYKKSLKIEPKEPKEPREPKNYTRKPLAAVSTTFLANAN